ncbi:MAG: hypothetical protein CVU55_00830 [Deltaproteobacteria bacterium HGW-Deltaproteobacteria-13]|nr:MAG: hypothetical protein CVU55_00830 [Deltaproteobacteria bacterium HGW-Deltaproteobacteria-13]
MIFQDQTLMTIKKNNKKEVFMKKHFLMVLILSFSILTMFALSACQQTSTGPFQIPEDTPQAAYSIDKLHWPGDSPYTINKSLVNLLSQSILTGQFGEIHSFIVIQNDVLVHESYYRGWSRHKMHPCFSATKSVTSALFGIAMEQGAIKSLDDRLLSYFPEYTDIKYLDERKESITLRHLLTMSAGLDWNEFVVPYLDANGNWNMENDVVALMYASDPYKYVLDKEVVTDPGTTFNYSSGSSDLLGGIIAKSTGVSVKNYAETNLFEPLGITKYDWPALQNGGQEAAAGLSLHPVNMAMFGYLYLKEGQYKGRQIISKEWVQESTAKHISFTMNSMDFDYGYQWWRWGASILESGLLPPLKTNDIYYAMGVGGQVIFVVPHLDLVVAVTSWNGGTPEEIQKSMNLCGAVLWTIKKRWPYI